MIVCRTTSDADGPTLVLQIRGSLPPVPHPEAGSPDTPGTWLTAAEVAATTDFKRTARQRGYLQAAYQVTMGHAFVCHKHSLLRNGTMESLRCHLLCRS